MTTRALDHPATYNDLLDLPPEARAEIFDGVIIMSPGASLSHNRCSARLWAVLDAAGHPYGYSAGLDNDVQWSTNRITRPDIFVITTAHAESDPMPVTKTPVIVVEILSPSSASRDLVRKREYCEKARVPEYWVVDLVERMIFRHYFVEGDTRYLTQIVQAGDELSIDNDYPFPFTLDTAVIFPAK